MLGEANISIALIGLFLALHGVVHLLYFGQSAQLLELQAGMVWARRFSPPMKAPGST